MSKNIRSIAKKYMNEAEEISAGEKNIGAENVSHEYYVVQSRDRFEALKRVLDSLPGVYGILFCRTRRETQEIADKLKLSNYDTEALHGEITQSMRTKIMDRFKRKQISLLVATDVAARGIDVNDLTHVINYNLPDQNESYTHRSGRTGRARKSGISISLVTPREVRTIEQIENIIGKKFEQKKIPNGEDIYRKQIDSFLEKIENAKIENLDNKYLLEIIEKLKKINKEDLIKHFVAYEFGNILSDHKNSRDLNTKAITPRPRKDDSDNVDLKINFGKKHGLDVKGVFSLLNSKRNLKGVEVGKINLMPEYSIFSVEKKRADDVLKYLQGTNFRGKKIEINKNNQNISYSNRQRSKTSNNFRGKRKNKPSRNFTRK
jgi:ATP-dependent RNA helicase DeaD